jgi:anti-sigma regulatory factor (Ser/Thr protein kinase)
MDGLVGERHAVLEGSAGAPAEARALVLDALGDGPEQLVDAARLVVSELVTTAVRHGSRRVVVAVRRGEGRVRLEVTEQTVDIDEAPTSAIVEGDREDEWSAGVVETLADAFGRDMRSDGMMSWVELEVP